MQSVGEYTQQAVKSVGENPSSAIRGRIKRIMI
nr:MAG TPA: hypothetical protein [Caudoviricetes sp.]